MPMKITNSITTSITRPSSSRLFIRSYSYFNFLAVLELAAEADLIPALQRLRDALDHEQQRRERHRGAKRPEDRPPGRLLGGFLDLERIPGVVPADIEEGDHHGEEQQQVRDQIDHALFSLGVFLPEPLGAHVRPLQ